YGYTTSPGETSAEKLQGGLLTSLPQIVPKITKGVKNVGDTFSPMGNLAGEAGEGLSSLQDIVETIRRPQKIQEEMEGLATEKQTTGLSTKQASEDFLQQVENAVESKENMLGAHEAQLETLWEDASKEKMRGNLKQL